MLPDDPNPDPNPSPRPPAVELPMTAKEAAELRRRLAALEEREVARERAHVPVAPPSDGDGDGDADEDFDAEEL